MSARLPPTNRPQRILRRIYQLFGFSPIVLLPTDPSTGTGSVHLLPTCVHLILATMQLCVVLLFYDALFAAADQFDRINDTVKYCAVSFTYYTICIESYLRRGQQSRFWQRYARLQRQEPEEQTTARPATATGNRVDRRVLLQLAAFVALVVLGEMIMVRIIIKHVRTLSSWGMFAWSVMISRIRHWQFVHYVRLLAEETRRIGQRVRAVAQYSAYGHQQRPARGGGADGTGGAGGFALAGDECWHRFVGGRLHAAQCDYDTLFEMAQDVNTIFGWSQLANCMQSYVHLMSDMYWVYWRYYYDKSFPLIQYLFCLVPTLIIIVTVFSASNRCTLQAGVISTHLHGIKKSTVNGKLSALMEAFSLQMIHQPVEFHAKGFFRVNYEPMRDMIAAITTYMVFFISFTPTLSDHN